MVQIAIGKNISQKIIKKEKHYSLPKLQINPACYYFVGRETELKDIYKLLTNTNGKYGRIQICAIGGIGKSELIAKFCMIYKEEFSEIHYWQWPKNCTTIFEFKKAWIDSIEISPLDSNIEEKFLAIMNDLYNLTPPNQLLIVDNVPEDINEEIERFAFIDVFNHLQSYIIIGTRKEYTTFPSLYLNTLDDISCKNLFEYCWGKKLQQSDMENYKKIVEWCDYHTLTIELMGITLKNKNETLEWLIEQLKKNGVNFSQLKVKPFTYSTYHKKAAEHLSILFNLQNKCNLEQIRILQNLCLFPGINIPEKEFITWINNGIYEDYENEIITLIECGYIKRTTNCLKMHPLISEVTLNNMTPTWENCQKMIDSISINMQINLSKSEHATQKKFYMPLAEILIQYFDGTITIEYARLSERLGWYNFVFGYHDKALNNYLISIKILKLLNISDNFLGQCFDNIALVYRKIHQFEKAFSYHYKALNIYTKISLLNENVADIYNNIGLVYYDMANSNIESTNNLEKALEYLVLSLKINKTILYPIHPDIATTYHNIGLVYHKKGLYTYALTNFKKAYNIRIKCLQKNHADILTTFFQAGLSYYKLKNPKCIIYIEKATKEWEIAFGSNNTITQNMKEALYKAKNMNI